MKHLPLHCLPLLTALLLALLPLGASAQDETGEKPESSPYQTLVSQDGTAIEAQILRFENSTVFIRRKDGQNFNFPLSMLNEQSRKKVREWAVDNALANALEVRVRERTLKRDRQKNALHNTETKAVQLNFTLTNKSETPLDNLRVDYRIYIRKELLGASDKDFVREQVVKGTFNIKQLAPKAETVHESDTIDLIAEKMHGNVVPMKDNNRSSQDKVDGYWYRIYRGNNMIAEESSPRRLMRVKSW